MGSARILILVAAAIAAIILMLIVGKLISHKPAPAAPVATAPIAVAKPMTNVIVAAHDLAIGTRIAPADLAAKPWPDEAMNPAYITDGAGVSPQQSATAVVANQTSRAAADAVTTVTGGHSPKDALIGAIVKVAILANEPIVNAKLVRGGDGGFMSIVLPQGMRAIAVPVSVNTAAGGFILPGDRVDVLQAGQVEVPINGIKPYVATTLLRNVRVLAIDQSAQPPKNGGESIIGAVATLEVSPSDAVLIALAKVRGGEISLTLRSYADAKGASGRGGTINAGAVHIIRNGQPSDITVMP